MRPYVYSPKPTVLLSDVCIVLGPGCSEAKIPHDLRPYLWLRADINEPYSAEAADDHGATTQPCS